MTIKEFACSTGISINTNNIDADILNMDMTEDMIRQINDELLKTMKVYSRSALVGSVTNPKKKWAQEDFDILLDKVEQAEEELAQYIIFAYDEEHKKQLERIYPKYRIEVLPRFISNDYFDEKCIYLVPTNDKPIKFIY